MRSLLQRKSLDNLYALVWTLIVPLAVGCATSKPVMAVIVPVSDLRAQPHTTPQLGTHDTLQETQLLYGERVRVRKVEEGWAFVEAIEQPEFTHARRWQGYPGWLPVTALARWEPLLEPNIVVIGKWAPTWIDANILTPSPWQFPLGTRLRATDMGGHVWSVELLDGTTVWMAHQYARSLQEVRELPPLERRRLIVRNAEAFLGDSYYWGGRSPKTTWPQAQVTGVDCSGLINLAYRAAGLDIPRDAHEQFVRARRVNALQPADLIFLSERNNPSRIVHVMLYAGNGELIEGPGTGLAVRRISAEKRLGQSLDWLASGALVDGQTVFFGTYLP